MILNKKLLPRVSSKPVYQQICNRLGWSCFLLVFFILPIHFFSQNSSFPNSNITIVGDAYIYSEGTPDAINVSYKENQKRKTIKDVRKKAKLISTTKDVKKNAIEEQADKEKRKLDKLNQSIRKRIVERISYNSSSHSFTANGKHISISGLQQDTNFQYSICKKQNEKSLITEIPLSKEVKLYFHKEKFSVQKFSGHFSVRPPPFILG